MSIQIRPILVAATVGVVLMVSGCHHQAASAATSAAVAPAATVAPSQPAPASHTATPAKSPTMYNACGASKSS